MTIVLIETSRECDGDSSMLPESYFDEWNEVREGTKKVAALIPDNADLSWRPHPDTVPLGELTRHIVGATYFMLIRWLEREITLPNDVKSKEPLNKQRFLEELSFTDAHVQNVLKELELDDLKKNAFTDKKGKSYRIGWVVWHLKDHEIHHRAQLKLYLKLMGVDTSAVELY